MNSAITKPRGGTRAHPPAENRPVVTDRLSAFDDAVAAAQALADRTRLRLLMRLSEGEATVGSLVAHLKMPQPMVSHHLAILRALRVVEGRREGRSVRYRLTAPAPAPGVVRVSPGGTTVTITFESE
jgi:DNA-binding transcriptional ArsR family regulator